MRQVADNLVFIHCCDKAPFSVRADFDAETVANEVVACFNFIETLPNKTLLCFDAICLNIGVDASDPLVSAGRRIADEIGNGIGGGEENAYHSRQHFCEVLLGVLFLGQLAGITGRPLLQLAVAALIHDFHHDGTRNGAIPFRLEKKAIEEAAIYFRQAGVSGSEIEHIGALVLSTDILMGVPYAVGCYRHFAEGGDLPEPVAESGALALVASDFQLARQAVLLTEADVLPSVGLTIDYSMHCQSNLEREWGVPPLGPSGKLAFLDGQFHEFVLSRVLNANVDRLRQYLRQQLATA